MKRNVYLCQTNNTYGRNAFLPYSVALLQSYALTKPEIRDHYNFAGFVYLREPIEDVIARFDQPDVFGVSCYIWNWNYSTALARAVKEAYPDCLIVLGGPHVPTRSEGFFLKHNFADLLVHYEGEGAFADILCERLKDKPDYTAIPGLSVCSPDRETIKTVPRPRFNDLEVIPSPYLAGIFDALMDEPYDFHATEETNRGCPYSCAFCDWGSNIMAKLKNFSTDRLVKEINWFGDHKIELLYNADANFAILERDIELVKQMVATKERTGYPEKFRAAYAKNSNERVFEVARLLHHADMNKGVTLSFQSMDDNTLQIVKRKNIKVKDFSNLIKRYNQEGIATYSELIIGLPGETYDTFADGINTLISSGQHSSLSIYTCELLPNSEMNQPEYREKHGIQSVHTPVLFFHGTPTNDPYCEYYELVTGTATLPAEDWLKSQLFSWIVQALHCLSLTQSIAVFLYAKGNLSYRSFYEGLLKFAEDHPHSALGEVYYEARQLFNNLRNGKEWGIVDQRFGNIVWPLEEGAFLKLIVDRERFYEEISSPIDTTILQDLQRYQSAMVRAPFQELQTEITLNYNIHEFIEAAYLGEKIELRKEPTTYIIEAKKKYTDLEEYAKEVVWYGRKGGKFKNAILS